MPAPRLIIRCLAVSLAAAGIRAAAVCTGKLDAAGWAKVLPAEVPVYPGLAELVAALPAAAGHA